MLGVSTLWGKILGLIPVGGTAGKVLAKKTDNDYDVEWISQSSSGGVPLGGSTNQVLAKNSNADLDLKWATVISGSGDRNVDGGNFSSVYLPSQTVNGGSL